MCPLFQQEQKRKDIEFETRHTCLSVTVSHIPVSIHIDDALFTLVCTQPLPFPTLCIPLPVPQLQKRKRLNDTRQSETDQSSITLKGKNVMFSASPAPTTLGTTRPPLPLPETRPSHRGGVEFVDDKVPYTDGSAQSRDRRRFRLGAHDALTVRGEERLLAVV